MKRNFVYVLVTLMAFATFGLSAEASELDIGTAAGVPLVDAPDVAGTVTGSITVASQLVAAAAVNADVLGAGLAGPRFVVYTPTIAMNANAIIEITVVGGAVAGTAGNVFFLLTADANGDATQAGTMTDFVADASGDYTWMRFQITMIDKNGDADTADPGEDSIASGTILVLSEAMDGTIAGTTNGAFDEDGPTFVVPAGTLAGGVVTLQVTLAKDDTGSTQNAPLTAAETVITVQDGIQTTLTAGTSVIDVEAALGSRLSFVEEGGAGDAVGANPANDTDLQASAVANLSVNVASTEIGFTLDGADSYALTLQRADSTGVTDTTAGVTWEGVVSDGHVAASGVWTEAGVFTDAMGVAMLAGHGAISVITTGGSILETGDWLLSLVIDTNDVAAVNDQVELTDTISHIWTINGSQFIIPYFTSWAHRGTYVIITNTSAGDANVFVDVWTDGGMNDGSGLDAAGRTATNIAVGSVPGNSTGLFFPADIEAAVDTALGSGAHKRYLLRFTVIAPNDMVHAVAFQADGTVKRPIPVLTNTAHEWKE